MSENILIPVSLLQYICRNIPVRKENFDFPEKKWAMISLTGKVCPMRFITYLSYTSLMNPELY